MYVEHWKKPGFWVRRTTWGNTIAKVEHVGDLKGRAPYYGNPEVRASLFDLHTGEKKDSITIDTAGTYKTWRWVDPPPWSDDHPFDPEADRIKIFIPFGDNKKASSMGARWSDMLDSWWIPEGDNKLLTKAEKRGHLTPGTRLLFTVPFEQKDIAQGHGAKWHSNEKAWSLSQNDTRLIQEFERLGFVKLATED